MKQTVVAVFENDELARFAVERLVQLGFNRGFIDVTYRSNFPQSVARSAHDEQFLSNRIALFFDSILTDEDGKNNFMRAAFSGATIVTVLAQDVDDAMQAARILDNCPLDHHDISEPDSLRSDFSFKADRLPHPRIFQGAVDETKRLREEKMRERDLRKQSDEDLQSLLK